MKLLLVLLAVAGSCAAVKWAVPNGERFCVVLQADTVDAQLNLLVDQNTTSTVKFSINATESVGGDCNATYGPDKKPANLLTVSFFPNGDKPKTATEAQAWELKLWFGSNPDEKLAFELVDYELTTAPYSKFNSTTQKFTKATTSTVDVQATEKNAFKCSVEGLALSSDGTVELKGVQVVAQANLPSAEFPKEQTFELCVLDTRTSDIVPIVVGACLAGLVIVVLVAYLVGRARAKRQGYASV